MIAADTEAENDDQTSSIQKIWNMRDRSLHGTPDMQSQRMLACQTEVPLLKSGDGSGTFGFIQLQTQDKRRAKTNVKDS